MKSAICALNLAKTIWNWKSQANAPGRPVKGESDERREDLLSRYPDIRPGSRSKHVAAASARFLSGWDIAMGTLEWLCWRRFGKPLPVLLAGEQVGALEDHEKVLRLTDEFWRLVHGHGPIVQFKGNRTHAEIIELGFGLGLDKLTGDELADCLEEVCPCGNDHDADALKKKMATVRKQLKTASEERLRPIPVRQRFAAHGAHGITAKPYHWVTKGIRHIEIS